MKTPWHSSFKDYCLKRIHMTLKENRNHFQKRGKNPVEESSVSQTKLLYILKKGDKTIESTRSYSMLKKKYKSDRWKSELRCTCICRQRSAISKGEKRKCSDTMSNTTVTSVEEKCQHEKDISCEWKKTETLDKRKRESILSWQGFITSTLLRCHEKTNIHNKGIWEIPTEEYLMHICGSVMQR